MQYHGLYLYLRRPPWDFYNEDADYNGAFLPETTSGRVVIDSKTFNEEVRAKKEEIAAQESDDDEKKEERADRKLCGFSPRLSLLHRTDKVATFDVSDAIVGQNFNPRLCPSYAYGFSFEKKEWCKFFIDSLSTVE